jgi:hypothetical protein
MRSGRARGKQHANGKATSRRHDRDIHFYTRFADMFPWKRSVGVPNKAVDPLIASNIYLTASSIDDTKLIVEINPKSNATPRNWAEQIELPNLFSPITFEPELRAVP